MSDDHSRPTASRTSGVITFVGRLCVIAWLGAIFAEVLPRGGIKSACILFGSHAAALGFLSALVFWIVRRQGLLFLMLLITAPPLAYFSVVILNIARIRHWIS
jgi:hypothetical protein